MAEKIKRGETLAISRTRVDGSGAPVDLTGQTVVAAVTSRDGTFYAAITVIIDDAAAGEFTLAATAAQTALWPVGLLRCDVRYAAGGVVAYSETIDVSVELPVTVH